MTWRESVKATKVWLAPTGMEHVVFAIDRVGPLFKVHTYGDQHFGAQEDYWQTLWFFTYKGANDEYNRRKLVLSEEINFG